MPCYWENSTSHTTYLAAPAAFVMGLRDSRLPSAVQANEWLRSQGYRYGRT